MFTAGLIACVVGWAALGATTLPAYHMDLGDRAFFIDLAALAVVPLTASVVVRRNRQTAGWIFLGGAGISLVCSIGILLSMIIWRETILLAAVPVLGFSLLGVFWLTTFRRRWPVLLDPEKGSWRRKLAGASIAIAMVILIAFGAFRLSIPGPMSIDCGPGLPFAEPKAPGQAVFIARAVTVQGWPARFLNLTQIPIGNVKEHFWGLPFWSRNLVLLTLPLRDGEIYFVDGSRAAGLLTRFLPIVEINACGRTTALRNAGVDIRVLRDGPRPGVRIIGTVTHRHKPANNDYRAAGVEVLISGPQGTSSVHTDGEGIYDIAGLASGEYSVSLKVGATTPGRGCRQEPVSLTSGSIWGCELVID